MRVNVHTFMRNTYCFDAVTVRAPKENHVASLGKFFVAFPNVIGTRCILGSIGKPGKGVKQRTNVDVTLRLAPAFQRVFSDLSQVSVCSDRESEFFHLC